MNHKEGDNEECRLLLFVGETSPSHLPPGANRKIGSFFLPQGLDKDYKSCQGGGNNFIFSKMNNQKQLDKISKNTHAALNAADSIRKSIVMSPPELDANFAELMKELANFITNTGAENVTTEKSKSNMATLLLILKQMNSFGANELLDETVEKHAEHLGHPAGREAIKTVQNLMDSVLKQ